jgi:predicted transcriptional regulator
MPFASHTDRIRSTPATRRRDDNVRAIITALRERHLMRDEIAALINMGRSGANKYVAMLREAGVIEIERYVAKTVWATGKPVYRLNPDTALVDGYLRSLDTGTVSVTKPVREIDHTRHVHLTSDDCNYHIKLASVRIPPPDPLLAAFFGLAKPEQHA